MTSAALTIISTDPAPTVTGQVFDVLISKIRVGPRLRELDQQWATALAGIMDSEGGQTSPIDLRPVPGTDEYELGPGLHRLAARKIGGHATVRAFIHDGMTALDWRSREISENLWRKGLEPLERAAFVADLHQVLRLKAGLDDGATPQSVAARARWEKEAKGAAEDASANLALAYGFTDEIADAVGLSKRAVYRDLSLHRALAGDVVAAIRGQDFAKNASQLQALAKLPHDDQRKVAAEISEGRAKGVSDAVAALSGAAKPSDEAKRLSAFIGAFSRMGLAEKKAALKTLAGLELPKGFAVTAPEAGR